MDLFVIVKNTSDNSLLYLLLFGMVLVAIYPLVDELKSLVRKKHQRQQPIMLDEKRKKDKSKFDNNEIIKFCFKTGLFKKILETEQYIICNAANQGYLYIPFIEGIDGSQVGIICDYRVLVAARRDLNAPAEIFLNSPDYVHKYLTRIRKKYVRGLIKMYKTTKDNPNENVNLELEEKIIKKYNQKCEEVNEKDTRTLREKFFGTGEK